MTSTLATRCGAVLLVLASACGPSQRPASHPWAYAGNERPVVSWPVMDEDGHLFVLVGEGAQVIESAGGTGLELDAVSLVSLDPHGRERWSIEVAGAMTVAREVPVRPIVGPGGDVWVHLDEVLTRVSASGEVAWRHVGLPSPVGYGWSFERWPFLRAALDASGSYYALPRIQLDTSLQRQQLRAIGPDGTERWAFDPATPGYSGFDFSPLPSQTNAPLVDPGGRVMVGCDLCEDLEVGIVRFDSATGPPAMLFSVRGAAPAFVQQLLWDGTSTWVELHGMTESGVWSVTPSGTATRQEHAIQLVADSGVVWMDTELDWGEPSFRLHWGDGSVDVSRSPDVVHGEIVGAVPVAIVEPPAVLLTVHVSHPSPTGGASEADDGLLLVDREGMASWYQGGALPGRQAIPAVGDGFIAYIDAQTQRLVAVEAPVERLADGAWPILGGDPQGTRSAEGR